ncbi:hypothetical protein GJ496_004206 [Pomphorhynchus laevis]|nr:hypothetical protein GJ496_004206 [Pomphorhynchus laevis]
MDYARLNSISKTLKYKLTQTLRMEARGVPVEIKTTDNPDRFYRDSSYRGDISSKQMHTSYDKMSHRIKEFEEECRRWREKFFNESKLGRPSSAMLREQPQLCLDEPDFPEFPSDWSSSGPQPDSSTVGRSGFDSKREPSYRSYLEEDLNGNKIIKIKFNVGDFAANELNVRVDGNMLIIKGEREIILGNTSKMENFSKELTIPDFADKSKLRSSLTSQGELIFECPVIDGRLTSTNVRGFLSYPFTSHSKSRTESHSGYNSRASSVTKSHPSRSPQRILSYDRGNIDRTQASKSWSSNATPSTGELRPSMNSEVPVSWPKTEIQGNVDYKENMIVYKFNVSGFNLDDLNIQVRDKIVLLIAQKEEFDSTGKTVRKFEKEIKVPDNADASLLRNSLSNDGILTVEIPMRQSYKPSKDTIKTTIRSDDRFDTPRRQQESVADYKRDTHVSLTEQNTLKLKYDLSGYRSDKIQVQVVGNLLTISAPRLQGSRDSTDFNQRYNLPEWADGNNARANITNDGILIIDIPRKH